MGADSGHMVFGATDCQTFNSVGIRIFGFLPTFDTVTFLQSPFTEYESPFFSFENTSTGEILLLDSLISGNLLFTSFSDKHGEKNGVVSGTFEFTVRNEELDSTVAITEGRFQYIIDYEWY